MSFRVSHDPDEVKRNDQSFLAALASLTAEDDTATNNNTTVSNVQTNQSKNDQSFLAALASITADDDKDAKKKKMDEGERKAPTNNNSDQSFLAALASLTADDDKTSRNVMEQTQQHQKQQDQSFLAALAASTGDEPPKKTNNNNEAEKKKPDVSAADANFSFLSMIRSSNGEKNRGSINFGDDDDNKKANKNNNEEKNDKDLGNSSTTDATSPHPFGLTTPTSATVTTPLISTQAAFVPQADQIHPMAAKAKERAKARARAARAAAQAQAQAHALAQQDATTNVAAAAATAATATTTTIAKPKPFTSYYFWTLKCTDVPQFDALQAAANSFKMDDKLHLRNLCNDSARCAGLSAIHHSNPAAYLQQGDGSHPLDHDAFMAQLAASGQPPKQHKIILDYSRQQVTGETMELLFDLADAVSFTDRREAMRCGVAINVTENRPVLHHLYRTPKPKGYIPYKYYGTTPNGAVNGGADSENNNNQNIMFNNSFGSTGNNSYDSTGNNSHNTSATTTSTTVVLDLVHQVRDQIEEYVNHVRLGIEDDFLSVTGKPFKNFLCISNGGSVLGIEFVKNALRNDNSASKASNGLKLISIANVDPVDFHSSVRDLDPEETLVIIISKTFTTQETMLNARTVRDWLFKKLLKKKKKKNKDDDINSNQQQHQPRGSFTYTDSKKSKLQTSGAGGGAGGASAFSNDSFLMMLRQQQHEPLPPTPTQPKEPEITESEIIAKHMIAISANPTQCVKFGLNPSNVFQYFDWINNRYSVCSPVGLLPLSLLYSNEIMNEFLLGAHDMDEHFFNAPLRDNIPVILGLLGIWNSTFLGYNTRGIIPYSNALKNFPQYVQQVDMESNGKRVALDGTPLLHPSGEITFGGQGINVEHSFYQLLHQGTRTVPVDFIGFMESQQPTDLTGEAVSNHDELMSNFFAQPDALAYGKTMVDLIQEGVAEPLRQHMVFTGNRPSSSLLITKLDAFATGQLLALYEHRTAVQGFIWGINSFDQYGIELGKTMAKHVRAQLAASRKTGASVQGFNSSTSSLLDEYLFRKG